MFVAFFIGVEMAWKPALNWRMNPADELDQLIWELEHALTQTDFDGSRWWLLPPPQPGEDLGGYVRRNEAANREESRRTIAHWLQRGEFPEDVSPGARLWLIARFQFAIDASRVVRSGLGGATPLLSLNTPTKIELARWLLGPAWDLSGLEHWTQYLMNLNSRELRFGHFDFGAE